MTRPLAPSTVIVAPFGMSRVPVTVLITHVTPSSRATIAPCDIAPPISITKAEATRKYEAHNGSVVWQTRTSPGSISIPASGSVTTRA